MNQMTRVVAAPPESFRARFTTAEFLRMCGSGAFEDWQVELVDGELQRMPPPGNDHSRLQISVIAALLSIAPKDLVRAETGIDLGDDTVLGCDAALLREPVSGNQMLLPSAVALVVEVAESTVGRDLGMKRTKYAGVGIAAYWVVDSARSVIHVHAEPIDGDYADIHTVKFGQPLVVPGMTETITLP